ncbi:tRNA(His) guanylyltransferase Thg1 family protein [Sulfurospirillum multivorans]|uniref:tRNA(His) guanylyltransferase Thg1 family protein n=1 Tax=Sulfurospirillum multivorans TaxID=66821 RepID=UPI00130DC7BB|nr:tRNA(His) guanylyltransferase Thg1 family protein [Sulfurospirillum multivorans]
MENDILTSLDKKFKAIEEKSQTMLSIPENYFLVVRLDGFHATKKYIKDSLENKEFRGNFSNAINFTTGGLNTFLESRLPKNFICAFSANDEVSIIINASLEEKAERRLFKICTLLSSVLSINFKPIGVKKEKVFFDARPLLLENIDEVHTYLKYRYLLNIRYGYWKVLRLKNNSFPDIDVNHDDIKCNLDNAKNLVIQKKLKSDFNIFEQNLIFHYPKYIDDKRKIHTSVFNINTYKKLL